MSPNSLFFISVISLTFTIFNSVAILALWVFYLSKQLSTHTVKVMDIKESIGQKKPVIKAGISDVSDEEAEAEQVAKKLTTAMFNRTKEKLTDSLM